MGASLMKAWENPGNYWDLVTGFLTGASGFPLVIYYPDELMHLPKKCTRCGKSSLKGDAMIKRMEMFRKRYRKHVDYIVAKRVLEGDPDPLYGFDTPRSREKILSKIVKDAKKKHVYLRKYLENSLPDYCKIDGDIVTFGPPPCYFQVQPENLVVCSYCGKGLNKTDYFRKVMKHPERFEFDQFRPKSKK